MEVTRRFAHRFRLLGLLRASLAAGAVVDLAVALALVVAPVALQRGLGISPLTVPAEGPPIVVLLPLLCALLLAMVAALYALAAHDPRRYSGIVLVAILGRLAGAALLAALASSRPGLAGLWPIAAMEGTLGLVHATTWIPLRV